jgi:hypothetical protein
MLEELEQALSQEELEQCCREHRLVARHLGEGVFLPSPLSTDIRRGHVVLDDIRLYFWKYAAGQELPERRQHWDQGPRNWSAWLVCVVNRLRNKAPNPSTQERTVPIATSRPCRRAPKPSIPSATRMVMIIRLMNGLLPTAAPRVLQ